MYFFHNFNTFYFLLVNTLNYMYFSLNQKKKRLFMIYMHLYLLYSYNDIRLENIFSMTYMKCKNLSNFYLSIYI